ncbi:hypothetical protein [Mucilaginibacter sp. BT774]|uniref:hypothetical protein n=1 Tax=Mucilaginibacter sp. BT774 TaxID=3062276 RepID=UPI00267645AA|nr:hypothetical protein [Mucilaginibacter sp. BT774]MDO3628894.1 hypothetical protein [Mucilaginibacter sp. BT774]
MYTLITAAATAEAYRLKNALNKDDVILGDYIELPDILVRSGKVIALPNPKNSAYTHQVLALCLDKGISNVYALREEEKELLQNAKQLFGEYDIQIETADDKI